MRVGGQTLARVATLIDSHQLSSSFDRALSHQALASSKLSTLTAFLKPSHLPNTTNTWTALKAAVTYSLTE